MTTSWARSRAWRFTIARWMWVPHGVRTEHELGGDLIVAQALGGQCRHLAFAAGQFTRYDKTAEFSQAAVTLASLLIWV